MILSAIEFFNRMSMLIIPFFLQEIIYSTILFVIILILTTLLNKKSAYWHLGLWALVLIRLLMPPDFSLPYSLRSLLSQLFRLNRTNETISVADNVLYIENSMPTHYILQQSLESISPQSIPIPWQSILFMFWLTGFITFFFIYLKRLLGYHRLLKKTSPVKLDHQVDRWGIFFKIKRSIQRIWQRAIGRFEITSLWF